MSASPLRIIFAGTPDFAREHLQSLIDSEHQVIAVYTQPDRPSGRGKKLTPSPVKALACEHDIAVYQPLNFKAQAEQQALAALQADLMVVVAYGLILPQVILDTPRLGCINVHASILPRWRGAAPIQRAIEAGDKESGVTIMQMDIGLDTGDMLKIARCAIEDHDSGGSLHDKLIPLGQAALLETLNELSQNHAQAVQQDERLSNYAPKFSKAEMAIDWQQAADSVYDKIRAYCPFPVATCESAGERVRIWAAQRGHTQSDKAPGTIIASSDEGIEVRCGVGSILITQLQIPGKKAMPASDVLKARAERFAVGQVLA